MCEAVAPALAHEEENRKVTAAGRETNSFTERTIRRTNAGWSDALDLGAS
jgi:hypothetical protein